MITILSTIIIVLGLFFTISGILGIIRFPTTFTKIHAASVTDTVGIPLILLGLAMMQNNYSNSLKILILIPLIWILVPIATHALAKATYESTNSKEKNNDL